MANTATLRIQTPHRLVYELAGDGTVVGPTIASATLIADSAPGPLRDALSASYSTQALMRNAMLHGSPCTMRVVLQTTVNDVTAERNQVGIDVDVDAVTATRPEINIVMSDTTGQLATLMIEYLRLINR
jgi:hypothetical protein